MFDVSPDGKEYVSSGVVSDVHTSLRMVLQESPGDASEAGRGSRGSRIARCASRQHKFSLEQSSLRGGVLQQ